MHETQACPICGGAAAVVIAPGEISIGRRSVMVEDEYFECQQCKETFVSPEQMDRVQRRASAAIRAEEGLLLPAEIVEIRDSLGLSQSAFEKLLGVGPKTVVRWEKGTVFQNSATDALLRLVGEDRKNAVWLAKWHDVDLPSAPPSPRPPPGELPEKVTFREAAQHRGTVPVENARRFFAEGQILVIQVNTTDGTPQLDPEGAV